jgi:hypothetical protein
LSPSSTNLSKVGFHVFSLQKKYFELFADLVVGDTRRFILLLELDEFFENLTVQGPD